MLPAARFLHAPASAISPAQPPAPSAWLLRLEPHLHLTVEAALAGGSVEVAVRHLAESLSGATPPVDGLRLLALAARQFGAEDEAANILRAAHGVARRAGDLIGAVDALRRLDAMGADSDGDWAQFLSDVATQGFGPVSERARFVEGETLEGDVNLSGVFERVAGMADRPRGAAVPFGSVPLLDVLPPEALPTALRALQLRVATDGQPLGKAMRNAPAWIAAGSVEARGSTAVVPVGTLVLPGTDTPVAHGPVRLLALSEDVWQMFSASPDVRSRVAKLDRDSRLTVSLRESTFYRCLTPAARHAFVHALNCVVVRNTRLIATGRPVRGLFFLVRGNVIVIERVGDAAREIARLETGQVFGELDVLTAGGAGYDVIADGEVELCYLPSDEARALLSREPAAREYLVRLTEERSAETREAARAGAAS